jgi:hypothetical protein
MKTAEALVKQLLELWMVLTLCWNMVENMLSPSDNYRKIRVKKMVIIYSVFSAWKKKMTQKRKQQKQVSKNSHKQTRNVL